MPTDIALSTNSPTGALELRQAQPMPDGTGYATLLVVRSGAFAAAIPFFVGTDEWERFVRALPGIAASDAAAARLPSRAGDDFVAIGGGGDGFIVVSGTLHELDEQQLRFRFTAPAGGLPQFIAAARALSAAS